jgi:hypothetical protein
MRHTLMSTAPLCACVLWVCASTASAAEVQVDGFYRARARAFDTLSLDRNLAASEGLAAYAQHRLWLRPHFLITDQVSMHLDVRGLDGVYWGSQPAPVDPLLDDPALQVFDYGLTAPTSATDESAPLLDVTLWRAWGEVDTEIGRFTFGRVPLHWGTGMWLNDGVSLNPAFTDYGDTTDRVMWELLVRDQIYVRAAVDVPSERFISQVDDTTAFNGAVAYKAEDLTAGILLQVDRTAPQDENTDAFTLFSIDGATDVTLGALHVAGEVVAQFGNGDLGQSNDAVVTSVGAVLEADLDLDPWAIHVQGGLATGDGDVADQRFKTFVFDRDYNIGLFLFEQPMPTLGAAVANDVNGGRDLDSVLTGNAVNNALFVKPSVSRSIVDGFDVHAAWLGARVAKLSVDAPRSSYGMEFQLGADYEAIEHFQVGLLGGLFLPGSYFSAFGNGEDFVYDDPAFGFQLFGRVSF